MLSDLLVLINGILEELDELVGDFCDTIDQSFAAFPNLFRIFDLWVRFLTSLAGRVLTIPISGSEKTVADLVNGSRFRNRAGSADALVRAGYEGSKKFVTFISGTDDSGILQIIAVWCGRWLWRAFKRLKFLLAIIGVANEQELIALVIKKFVKKARFYKTFAIIFAGFYVLTYAGSRLQAIGLGISIWDGSFEKLLWPQDSKRFWTRKSGSFRSNRGPGPDR